MRNEMINAVELSEMELNSIVGGRTYYIHTSSPITNANGTQCYEVFSVEGSIQGDIAALYRKGGASFLKGRMSMTCGTVPVRNFQRYCAVLTQHNDVYRTF